jgi:hypothetical protein
MVSLSIFVVIMILVMGSILSVLDLNNKIQSRKTAMDNLNFALESMTRTVRFGTKYHCGTSGDVSTPAQQDCVFGDNSITLRTSDGVLVTYFLSNGAIMRTLNGSTLPLTSPEVTIQTLNFFVLGSYPASLTTSCPQNISNDCLQPRIIITISGIAGSTNKAKTQSTFHLETTLSERKFDI